MLLMAMDNGEPCLETRRTSAKRKKNDTCYVHSKKSETVENRMQHCCVVTSIICCCQIILFHIVIEN